MIKLILVIFAALLAYAIIDIALNAIGWKRPFVDDSGEWM